MQLNQFTLLLVVLFLPGLLCAILVNALTSHAKRNPIDFLIPSFIYGYFVLLVYRGVDRLRPGWLPPYSLLPPTDIPSSPQSDPLQGGAILAATCIAVALAFLLAYGINKKFLHRIARMLTVTQKFGEPDVWNYVMSSDGTDWITVRDWTNNKAYSGRIVAHSDDEAERELVLADPILYDNETGVSIGSLQGWLYFSFPRDGITLEIVASQQQSETSSPT